MHTYTGLTAVCPGLPGWADTRKVTKTILILLKQETVSGSGISWTTCKSDSTPPLRFLQSGCPSCRPTNSVKALKAFCWMSRILLYIVSPVLTRPVLWVALVLFQAWNLPFLQILPIVAFYFFFRTDSTDSRTVNQYVWAYPFLLVFFLFHFLTFGSMRQIKLTYVSFWAHVKTASLIVSSQGTKHLVIGRL